MSKQITISIDAMGGDAGPDVVLPGAAIALTRRPELRFVLFGDEARIAPVLTNHPALAAASRVVHTDVVVRMDDKPSQALRAGRWKSSMWKAIEAVKTGEASVCVSAGNTGALMAMAKFCLRTMAGIERPAIAAIWPTLTGESIVLDVGATIGADAQQLVDFSVMGAAMARAVLHVDRPTVGLLNVGVEEVKGAGRLLKEADIPELLYFGFVEGDDIGRGKVHVVVTEGFSGNIALKTAEGTAKQFAQYLREGMNRSWINRLGFAIARSAFDRVKEKMDPRKVNGGVFLGLNGVVVKSHGGADAESFASAVGLAYDMGLADLTSRIAAGLVHYHRTGLVAVVPDEARGEQ